MVKVKNPVATYYEINKVHWFRYSPCPADHTNVLLSSNYIYALSLFDWSIYQAMNSEGALKIITTYSTEYLQCPNGYNLKLLQPLSNLK